jgi:hypothetical protein
MIFEAIIGGLTLSFLGSLLLGNSLVKKLRQWDLEDDEEPPMIYSFQEIKVGSPCVKCGRKAENETKTTHAYGPLIPKVCEEAAIKCKANKISHLHMKCNTCKATWFMATADSVIPEKENVIRNVKTKSKNKS